MEKNKMIRDIPSFAGIIALLRLRESISIAEIAKRIDASYTDVHSWSANKTSPAPEQWRRLVIEFNLTLDRDYDRLRQSFSGHHKEGSEKIKVKGTWHE